SDRAPIDVRDYVEWTQVALRGRSVRFDGANHHAFVRAFKQLADRRIIAKRLDPNAQPGSHDFVSGYEFASDVFGHVDGNRKAQSAVHPIDQGLHPDPFPIDVAQRTTAIPRINRRISLQIILDGVAARLKKFSSAFAADHATSKSII